MRRARCGQPVAQHQVRLQLGAAQVEHPVLEAQLLGGQLLAFLARHRDRGRDGRADHAKVGHVHLDVARGECGVAATSGRRPTVPSTSTTDSVPAAAARAITSGDGPARVEGELHDPGAVAQVDEDEPAEVAAPVNPAAQSHRLTDLVASQLAAPVRAHRRRSRWVHHHRICHMCHGPNVTHIMSYGYGQGSWSVQRVSCSMALRNGSLEILTVPEKGRVSSRIRKMAPATDRAADRRP